MWKAMVRDSFSQTSAAESRFELRPLALAERDRNGEPLEMLIDQLVAEPDLVPLEEGVDLGLAIEQADDRFAHPRQSAVGVLVDHRVPMLADKIPRLITHFRIVEQ